MSWRDTPPEQGDEAPPIPALEPIMPSLREHLVSIGVIVPRGARPMLRPGALALDAAGRAAAARAIAAFEAREARRTPPEAA